MKHRILLAALPLLVLACSSSEDTAGTGGNAQAGMGGQAGAAGQGGTGGQAGAAGQGGIGGQATGGQAGAAGQGGTGGSTSGVPLDELASTAADAICGALFRCCSQQNMEDYFFSYANDQTLTELGYDAKLPPNAAIADEASCAALVAEMLAIVPLGDWIDQAGLGNVSYHPDVAKTCADALDGASCGTEVSAALYDATCFGFGAPVGPTQRSIFTRSMGPGANGCVPLRDGTGARFYGTCDPFVSFCCYENAANPGKCAFPFDADGVPRTGACAPIAEEGEACSGGLNNVQLCKTGLDCDYDTSVCVAPGTTPLQLGDACMDGSFNLLGECQDSWCDMLGTSKCEALKADGSSCVFPNECESGSCEGGSCAAPTYCTSP